MDDPDRAPPPPPGDGPEPDEPETSGTLFIMMVFLMALGAMWFIMYFILLDR